MFLLSSIDASAGQMIGGREPECHKEHWSDLPWFSSTFSTERRGSSTSISVFISWNHPSGSVSGLLRSRVQIFAYPAANHLDDTNSLGFFFLLATICCPRPVCLCSSPCRIRKSGGRVSVTSSRDGVGRQRHRIVDRQHNLDSLLAIFVLCFFLFLELARLGADSFFSPVQSGSYYIGCGIDSSRIGWPKTISSCPAFGNLWL